MCSRPGAQRCQLHLRTETASRSEVAGRDSQLAHVVSQLGLVATLEPDLTRYPRIWVVGGLQPHPVGWGVHDEHVTAGLDLLEHDLDSEYPWGSARRSRPVESTGMENVQSWRNRKTLILSRTDMMGLLTPAEYISTVEQAYRMHGEGRFYMDPKGHIVLEKYPGEWEAMPSYIEEPEAAACKWVSIRENNRERFDLPTVFSILIYTHPETGFPLAICDGSYHTVMRTGASAAVSARWMARKDSRVLAIVGAGHMAEGTLETCNEVFPWEDVRVWSRSEETLADFVAAQQPKYEAFEIRASTDLEQVVRGADVVVTVTPARGPIVMDEWIEDGTHIAAVGADKDGDQELEATILQRARIFVDDIRQCRTDGEINVPLSQGVIAESDIAGEIGEVVVGKKQGRTSKSEITVFDSTGIALQDSATVPLEYERAVAAGVGVEKKMIST